VKTNTQPIFEKSLVLVGCGHANIQVIKYFGMHPEIPVQLTVINAGYSAIYTGMVPGFVSSDYTEQELSFNLPQLCKWAGARFIASSVAEIRPESKEILFADRPSLFYDVCSINIGSTVAFPESIPKDVILSTRPVVKLVQNIRNFIDSQLKISDNPVNFAVVGAGAGGYELTVCLHAWFKKNNYSSKISLVTSGSGILKGYNSKT